MPSVDASGTELHYLRAGEGEPMLLIQGMSATHLAWGRPFLDELERSFDTIVFDNRGMGLSGQAELPFTIADLAADTAGLLDALELETVHVVGISMGGMIAQELALAHPERIRTLTIGASYCGGPEGTLMAPEDLQMLGDRLRLRRAPSRSSGRCGRSTSPPTSAPTTRASPPSPRWDRRCRRRSRWSCSRCAPAPPTTPTSDSARSTSRRWSSTATPTGCSATPTDAQIAALIPGARLETLEGVGHMFWWEQPAALGGADPRARPRPGLS